MNSNKVESVFEILGFDEAGKIQISSTHVNASSIDISSVVTNEEIMDGIRKFIGGATDSLKRNEYLLYLFSADVEGKTPNPASPDILGRFVRVRKLNRTG